MRAESARGHSALRAGFETRPRPEQGSRALSRHRPRLSAPMGPERVEAAAEHASDRREDLRLDQIPSSTTSSSRRPAPKRARGAAPIPSPDPRPTLLSLGDSDLLQHPPFDQLTSFGLTEWPGLRRLAETDESERDRPQRLARSAALIGASLSTRQRLTARLAQQQLHQRPASEMSTTAPCSRSSPGPMDRPHDDLALVGPSGVGRRVRSLAPSARRPATTTVPSSIIAARSYCERPSLTRGDGATHVFWILGRADFLILDDFGLEPLDAAPATISWKSLRTLWARSVDRHIPTSRDVMA